MKASLFIKFVILLLNSLRCIPGSVVEATDFESAPCTSTEGKFGLCVPLVKCSKLFSILHERPLRPDRLKLLQDSTCSFNAEQPWVCCDDVQSEKRPPTTTTATIEKDSSPTKSSEGPTAADDDSLSATTAFASPELRDQINGHPNLKLLPGISSCGMSSGTSDRIIGGQDAGLGTFPWMVLLGYRAPRSPDAQMGCGGTLINSLYVLTAAHCLIGLPWGFKMDFIRVGEYDQSSDIDCQNGICAPKYKDIGADQIILHEQYNQRHLHENDVALIRLKKPAEGQFVAPICLPQGDILTAKSSAGHKVIVAGWGRTVYNIEAGSQVLKTVAIPFVPVDQCSDVYAKLGLGKLDNSTQMCAGGQNGKDSCKGDSGGPLMDVYRDERTRQTHYWQMGVVSQGPADCGGVVPAVYSNIAALMPWILDNIKP